ncbi:Uncharacterized protein PBTT_09841 [Plasmodiophora brassicae]
MQCLHVGGFVLRRDGNLAYLDCADAPTSSLTIEWASTHDAVDGVVTRSPDDGHVLRLAANGRHGPVAYIHKEQMDGMWTIVRTSREDDSCIFVNQVPLHHGEVDTIEVGVLIVITSRDKEVSFACLHVS